MIKNVAEFYTQDWRNKSKKRTIRNVYRRDFNCAGYALDTQNWYCPYETDWRGEELFSYFRCSSITEEERLMEVVNNMLSDFKNELRIINDFSELQEDEYAILFKCGHNDFHYVKRGKNGHFFHKRGSGWYIERMSKEEALGDTWCNGQYYSRTVIFAKKIK